jgi:hypothetical protein
MDNQNEDCVLSVKNLTKLGKQHPLKGGELSKAKNIMISLKKMGYTNNEIHHLTNKTWAESTIKRYTRSTTRINPMIKVQHIELLRGAADKNLSLSEIEKTLSCLSMLDKKGIKIAELLQVVDQLQENRLLPLVANLFDELKSSRITVDKLLKIAQYKEQLEQMDFDIEFLQSVYKVSKKFRDKSNLLNGLFAYCSLLDIKSDLEGLHKQRDSLKSEITEKKEDIQGLVNEKIKLEAEIGSAKELESLGLATSTIRELKELGGKLQKDTETIVRAIAAYSSLAEIESRTSDLQVEEARLKNSIQQLKRGHESQNKISELSAFLVDKFKFNIRDLESIFQVAHRYGNGTEFFTALGEFSSLKELELKQVELKASVRELEKTKAELNAGIHTYTDGLISILERSSEGCSRVFQEIASKISTQFEQSLIDLRKSYDEYSTLRARMLASREELKFASTIKSIFSNNIEAISHVRIDFITSFIEGALNLCLAKNFNPPLEVEPSVRSKYGIPPGMYLRMVDILQMAKSWRTSL